MDCNAQVVETVTFDNGTTQCVEMVVSHPDYDYTFVVIRDANGNVQSLLLENVAVVTSEWY